MSSVIQSPDKIGDANLRTTIFVTHAAPEDNEFALWISSKLAAAGYRVWVDQRRLRGGDDFWDEIDRVLRNHAIKQVVVFTRFVGETGVKKELAIGDIVKSRLKIRGSSSRSEPARLHLPMRRPNLSEPTF